VLPWQAGTLGKWGRGMVMGRGNRRGPDRDSERRLRQIMAIMRLGADLRADLDFDSILTRIIEGILPTLGFRAAVLNLILPGRDYVQIAAASGLTEAERQRLFQNPPLVAGLLDAMRPDFCVSHSYIIPHQYKHLFEGVPGVTVYTPQPPSAYHAPDVWHPEDVFLVPLRSPHDENVFVGILSLDQPEDGRWPSPETVEMVELYGSQAALAIYTARLFAEREEERLAIQGQLLEIVRHLERLRQGDLTARVRLDGQALGPMAESLDTVAQTLDALLGDVRRAGEVVNSSATETREATARLAAGAQEQAQQILDVARAVEGMARDVEKIADIARNAREIALEAGEISLEGRQAAEGAAEGMFAVRELAIQSVKKMKRLGESAQDIGEIVQTVSAIADQTNILALNAAIEASRAGEHGRGFAIVAQAIRNLASSSAEAAKNIQARIKAIQNETNGVVITTEHSMQQIVAQSELATQAGAALDAVDNVTQRIAAAITEVSDTAASQAETAAEVARTIASIASITAQARDGMAAAGTSMDHLVELAQSLLRSLGVFTLSDGTAPQRAANTGTASRPSWPNAANHAGEFFLPDALPTPPGWDARLSYPSVPSLPSLPSLPITPPVPDDVTMPPAPPSGDHKE
jgi:methyl-accepting chemotaxis protein